MRLPKAFALLAAVSSCGAPAASPAMPAPAAPPTASPATPAPAAPPTASSGAQSTRTPPGARIEPVVIQRIVRDQFARFGLCYQDGLRRDPNLRGQVVAKFVIDRAGAVSSVVDGGSTIPDPAVVECVLKGYRSLSFPPPDGGIVNVVYPINFTPDEAAPDGGAG